MRAARAAENCFRNLDALPVTGDPICLRFDSEAQKFFDEWRKDLETTLRDGSLEHAALEGHLAKYRSLMPSLALLFQLADDQKANSVSLGSSRMAAAWCSFLEQHARRVYGMALTAEIRQAKAILRKIQSGQLKGRFTARDIYRKHWAGLSTPNEVNEPLRILTDHGYLQAVPIGKSESGGRGSMIYLAHPSILECQQ